MDDESLFRALEHEMTAELHAKPIPTYYAVKVIFANDQDPDNYEARIMPGSLTVSLSEAQNTVKFFVHGHPVAIGQALAMAIDDLALSRDRLWRLWAAGVCVIQTQVLDNQGE